MSWTHIPGIRQDHRGRYYELYVNSRGKQDIRFIERQWDAPAARMIPLPPEPKPKLKLKGPMRVRGADGQLREFKPFQPKRLHVIEYRIAGPQILRKMIRDNRPDFEEVIEHIKPLSISPDCGKTWQPIERLYSDWHVAYHLDEEQPK